MNNTQEVDEGSTFRREWFARSIIPMKVICQISMAGIEIYTNCVVSLVARNFKLPLKGQRNLNIALNNLPLFRSADEKLTFGWCPEHALRNMGVHEAMYEHLALEVAISEVFPERYAARILWEMARLYATDQDVLPHFRDMVQISRSSMGLFMTSDFSLLVEGYLRMLPDSGSGIAADQAIPAAEEMAKALTLLAQVTQDEKKQLTIVCGRVLAWFVTISEWLFDLRASIYLASGVKLYGPHGDQPAQLLAVFSPSSRIEAKIGSWKNDTNQATVASTECMSLTTREPILGVPFGGRVIWTTLLSHVFGQSFGHLEREESRTVGTILGAAARAYEDAKAKNGSLSKNSNSSSRPVGAALVKLLTDWLPELRPMQGRMEKQLRLGYDDARKAYYRCVEKLQQACGCELCQPLGNPESNGQVPPPYGYCLTVLTETIVILGMILSRLTVAASIYPAAQGVRNLYRRQCSKRSKAYETVKDANEADISDFVYNDEWDCTDIRRMQNCAELFAGSRPETDLPENLVALSHEGICVYLVGIESSRRSSRDEDQDLIRVTSGGIGIRFKVFSRAAYGKVAEADELENVWEEVHCAHMSQPLYCK